MDSSSLDPAIAEVAELARQQADRTERQRRPSPELVEVLIGSGLLRLALPAAYGGRELDPIRLVDVVEELACADASIGWLVATNILGSLAMGWVGEAMARDIYGDPRVATAGVYAPFGTAEVLDGRYRLSGRWAYASGCDIADWFLCGAVLFERGTMREKRPGRPEIRMLAFPKSAVTIHDTWDVLGMCGTGSHDISVSDVDIPLERSLSLHDDPPRIDAPLYRMPYFGVCAALLGSVAVGVARAASAEAKRVADGKVPLGARKPIGQRRWVGERLADAELATRTAHDELRKHLAACWTAATTGRSPDFEMRARLRIATCQAVTDAARAIETVHGVVGGTSVYRTSPLQRHLRDVMTLRQHVMLSPVVRETAEKLIAGATVDTSML